MSESSTPEGVGDAGLEAVPGDAPGEEDVLPVLDAASPGNGDPAVSGDPEADPGAAGAGDDPGDAPEEETGDEGGVMGGVLGV